MARAWIGLGSNLGDREATLAAAVGELSRAEGVRLVATSRVYQTDPVGPPPQGPYLNAAAELQTELAPGELLALLQSIEQRAGRVREGTERWSARTLDLDLLLYGHQGERQIEQPDLEVPHPRLHERAFVLVPLAEIAPEVQHPALGSSISELARALGEPAGIELHTRTPLEEQPWPSQP